MDRPQTLAAVRGNHEKLRGEIGPKKWGLVWLIEKDFSRYHEAQPEHLFGIGEYSVHERLRQAVARALHKHPNLKLTHAQIAAYLHISEAEVQRCLIDAETLLVAHAGSPESNDMMACLQTLGPAIGRVLAMVA